ncbi:HAMP domain-containing sensor histidine kinase [Dactylosporangium sp. NPDC049525]|uniref:sensor histidine kinase n=1 Tax=Dactylosporangium sp. NPDC049525 TaxID=3154730 RepID=UPI0034173406
MTAAVQPQFLQQLSHELRTPLTGIRGYSDVLREEVTGPLTERQRHLLTMLNSCVHRLDSLIDDLLLLASVDAVAFGLVVEDLDLSRLCDRAVRAHTAHARPDEPALRCVHGGGSCVVQADPRQLEHLLAALLNHAAGCFAGCAELRVSTGGDGTRAWVTVVGGEHDEPAGIVGLGLAVVRAIAEQHGGSVTDDGSELRVVLPRTARPGERVVVRPMRRAR